MSGRRRSIWLASASPRRERMLHDAGFDVRRCPPDLDDAALSAQRNSPRQWVLAMAWFKAARVRARLPNDAGEGALVAADTVCDVDGMIIGKPVDERAATETLRRLAGRDHAVHTGVCVIDLSTGVQRLLVDTAVVSVGAVDEAMIDAHLRSGAWRGKAGGYNYADAVAAGWPVRCEGDPTTVMGLPMRRLLELLGSLEADATAGETR